jgi:hypothetical protein
MRFLVIDAGGLCIDMARRIGQDGNDVKYYSPWQGGFPKFESGAAGYGTPDIEKVLDFAPHIDDADVIFFPDTSFGSLAHYLRGKGHRVFGAGLGEVLENDRAKSVEIMKQAGLSTPETFTVHGVGEARQFFKKAFGLQETNQSATGKYFVKLNIWRGTQDSFPVENMEIAEYMLKGLEAKFGPYAKSLELIIQKTVEGIECGFDALVVNGKFLKPTMIGFESSNSYIGYMSDDFSIWSEDIKKWEKILAPMNYCGFFSVEAFFDGKTNHYIDITCRSPLPLGLLYPTFSEDFSKLIYDIADGSATSSGFKPGTFLGGAEVECDNVKSEWLPLTCGKNTRLMRYMMQDGQCFSVPGGEATTAMVCGIGSSMEEVEEAIKKEAQELNIFFSKCSVDYLDKVRKDYIEPLKELGFDFDKLTQSTRAPAQDLKPVTPPKVERRERYAKTSRMIKEWSKEDIGDPLASDPLDEIRDMMESIKKPVKQQAKPAIQETEKKKSTVFAQPVDKYGIPI